MMSLFELALSDGGALTESQAHRFANVLVDAVADVALAAPELERQPSSNLSSLARVKESAQLFIDRNLSNPSLDAGLIANHCRVSLRYLHKAFAAGSPSIGTYVREARLEQCRVSLQSPAMQDKSVIEIAMMWGFSDPSHFGRAYKARFGVSPSKDRQPLSSLPPQITIDGKTNAADGHLQSR